MKLEIDTINKTVMIKEGIKLSDLMSELKKRDLEDYTLIPEVINNWSQPFIQPYYPITYDDKIQPYGPNFTTCYTTNKVKLNDN